MTGTNWDSITLSDDALFGSVFANNEHLCQGLVERLLEVPVDHVEYLGREREILPELGARRIRMDVYVADGSGRIINVEMQRRDRKDIARRSRYYLSANDMDCITPGQSYQILRDSYIVFICMFDPFKRGLPIYTCTACCREDGKELEDGATRMFIDATAWERCEAERLRPFLAYLDGTMIEGDEDFLRELDEAVREMRARPEWRRTYMRLDVRLADERAEGREEGLKEGRAEGRSSLQDAIARLRDLLVGAGRTNEFLDAMGDAQLRDRLFDEFGIEC